MVQHESPDTKPKARRVRSPAYPGITLEEALSRAESIRKAEGRNEAHVDTILSHWQYKPKSGAGLVVLSALIKFGLMIDNGSGKNRKARLTDLALKILLDDRPESQERLVLMREAALAPSIHRELWDKYQAALPSDLNLRYYLRSEKGFSDNAADELIQEYRQTLAFTKLDESANISPGGGRKPLEGEIKMPETLLEPKTRVQGDKGITKQEYEIKQVQIPLTDAPWAIIQVPVPMTEKNWQELQDFLGLMKGPVTGTPKQTRRLSVEAQELLSKIGKSGIPTVMSSNIETIARQHGITVNNNTTPDEVIEQLKKLQ
jgi:hypothetical protein